MLSPVPYRKWAMQPLVLRRSLHGLSMCRFLSLCKHTARIVLSNMDISAMRLIHQGHPDGVNHNTPYPIPLPKACGTTLRSMVYAPWMSAFRQRPPLARNSPRLTRLPA